MACLPRLAVSVCALLLSASWTSSTFATTWGIGAAAGSRPVLSVTVTPQRSAVYHVTSHLSDERVVLTGDLQRHMTPTFGYGHGWRLAFYGGVGFEGASERGGDGLETYRLRLPIGTQCDIDAAALAIFAEAAGTIGPLPKTALAGQALAGLRAVF
jgi:hypothetical protein